MSRTEGSTFEPATAPAAVIAQGAPVGAIPQMPAPGGLGGAGGTDVLKLDARSGDTDVVFRIERRAPLLDRLGDTLDRLADYRGLLIAGAIVLAAVGTLATVLGGAYHKPIAHTPALATATTTTAAPAPVAPPPTAAPIPAPAPAAAAPEIPSPPDRPARAVSRATAHGKTTAHKVPLRAKKPRLHAAR